jgi:hypothetical protein
MLWRAMIDVGGVNMAGRYQNGALVLLACICLFATSTKAETLYMFFELGLGGHLCANG